MIMNQDRHDIVKQNQLITVGDLNGWRAGTNT